MIRQQAYISFYNNYLYEICDENINRKKRIAAENKKEIMDKCFDRYGIYPDNFLKSSDPILKVIWNLIISIEIKYL